MAGDSNVPELPALTGFTGRVRLAWQVLRGGPRREGPVGAAAAARRAAEHPLAALLESIIAGLPGPAIV
ncbi:MAG TPA: hypothetical protein VE224_13540, partial [Pseudolabrys sp.]|nr:hypothetical protein [Pseudolabrys sp.]